GINSLYGGADSDIITSVGVDLVDGGTGDDSLNFDNGAGNYSVSTSVAQTVLMSGPTGAATVNNVEELNVGFAAGAGNFTIGDLSGTAVRTVNIASTRTAGGFGTAGLGGTLDISGTPASDLIETGLGPIGTSVALPWRRVQFASGGGTLQIDGNEGNDTIKVDPGSIAAGTAVVLNGGPGNDYLSADGTLSGGAGNDTLVGGAGN